MTDQISTVPATVRDALPRVRGVPVDSATIAAVRDRFDAGQAASLARYLGASQSPNTLRAYRSDFLAWSAWCVAEGRRALPADPLDLAVYLAKAADSRRADGRWAFAPATLERRAAAVAAVHAMNGLPSPTRADVVRLTLRGIRRDRHTTPKRKRPILLETLDAMLDPADDDAWPAPITRLRDRLLLIVGFAGALRRSELAAVETSAVRRERDPGTGAPLLLITLGVTKTDQTGVHGHEIVLPRARRPELCAVCAYLDWTTVLAAHRDGADLRTLSPVAGTVHRCSDEQAPAETLHGPLFPPITRHGHLGKRSMTDRAVANLVKRYAVRAGLDPTHFSGHSLRAGFATQAALGGASDREIMRQGRWVNAGTVHRYIRTANPLDDNAVTKLGL
jgi:site-specific recombinase XerD